MSLVMYNGTIVNFGGKYVTGPLQLKLGTGPNVYLRQLSQLNDGKVLIYDNFTSYNGRTDVKYLTKLNWDFSVDDTFNSNVSIVGSAVRGVLELNNGQIIIVGNFTSVNGQPRINIAKLNPNGTLDLSFDASSNNNIVSICKYTEDKFFISGRFTQVNGTSRNYIALLNTDGTLDNSFVPFNFAFSGTLQVDQVQYHKNKLLALGAFTSYNSTSANRIVRLNLDATIDASFAYGTGFDNTVRNFAIDSNDKIVVNGRYTKYNEFVSHSIIKINWEDGSRDISFDSSGGFLSNPLIPTGDAILKMTIDSSDNIICGTSTWDVTYKGSSSFRGLIRILPNGDIDNSFKFGQFTTGATQSLLVLNNGNIVASGSYGTYDSKNVNNMMILSRNGNVISS